MYSFNKREARGKQGLHPAGIWPITLEVFPQDCCVAACTIPEKLILLLPRSTHAQCVSLRLRLLAFLLALSRNGKEPDLGDLPAPSATAEASRTCPLKVKCSALRGCARKIELHRLRISFSLQRRVNLHGVVGYERKR